MNQLLVILALGFVSAANAHLKGGLHARFDIGGYGKTAFINVPKTKGEADKLGYVVEEQPQNLRFIKTKLDMRCTKRRELCVLYDRTGYVAGLQIALNKMLLKNAIYNMDKLGFTEWKASNGEVYYAIVEYFVTDEYLAQSPQSLLAKRNKDSLIQLDGIYVVGNNKSLVKLPKFEKDLVNTPFTKQGCFPGMGRHYFYDLTKNTPCTEDHLFPWFGLYIDGELIAAGAVTIGHLEKEPNEKYWFENPPELAVRLIAPHGPQCLYDLADKPTLTTMHTYFVDGAQTITCLSEIIGK